MSLVVCGCDIGQAKDPTALCVVEMEKILIGTQGEPLPDDTGLDWFNIELGLSPEPVWDTRYVVRSVRRLPLLLPYPAVAAHINAIMAHLAKRDPTGEIFLVVDASGVGAPVVDLIRQGIDERIHVTAVTITGGTKCPTSPLQRSAVTMSKEWMVSRLQALLQGRRLVMPNTPESQALAAELLSFEIHISQNGNTSSGAFKAGTHDDTVTGLALACIGDVHQDVRYTPISW